MFTITKFCFILRFFSMYFITILELRILFVIPRTLLNSGLLNQGSTVLNILNFVHIAVGSIVCHCWCWLCWSWLLHLEAGYPEPWCYVCIQNKISSNINFIAKRKLRDVCCKPFCLLTTELITWKSSNHLPINNST